MRLYSIKNNKKNNIYQKLILCYFLSWAMTSVYAGALASLSQAPSSEKAFQLSVSSQNNSLQIQWQISPHCYLYQNQLQINLLSATDHNYHKYALLKEVVLPKAQLVDDPDFGEQLIYRHTLQLSLPFHKLFSDKEILQDHASPILEIAYQGCAESLLCYPPQIQYFSLTFLQNKTLQIQPLKSFSPNFPIQNVEHSFVSPPENAPAEKKLHFLRDIGSFYLYGVLLTFTPCVFPMIPILFGVIVGQKNLNTRKAFWLSLSYVLSMAITYALAGILVATLGKNLQTALQRPEILIIFSALFALLGLTQLEFFHLRFLQNLAIKDWLHKLHLKQSSGTYLGAAVMGFLATLISSPCVTAPLILALSYISQQGNIILGGSALLALGLGMGTILLLIGTFGSAFIPKSGPWMHAVNHAFGIIMLALSLWLLDRIFDSHWLLILWGVLCLFTAWCMDTFKPKAGFSGRIGVLFVLYAFILFWGAVLGEKDPLKPLRHHPWRNIAHTESTPFYTLTTLKEFSLLQAKAKKDHRPMMVVFFADWCSSCQHLERNVFSQPEIQLKLNEWQWIRVDVTKNDSASQFFLKTFELIGPPAILFFDKDGTELTKFRIYGEISEKQFISNMQTIEQSLKKQ